MFKAVECTGSLQRAFTRSVTFKMNILDMQGREVVHLKSSRQFLSLPVVTVKLPDDQIIAYIKQTFVIGIPAFKIKNARYETILRVEGPFSTTSFGGNVDFDVSVLFEIKKN